MRLHKSRQWWACPFHNKFYTQICRLLSYSAWVKWKTATLDRPSNNLCLSNRFPSKVRVASLLAVLQQCCWNFGFFYVRSSILINSFGAKNTSALCGHLTWIVAWKACSTAMPLFVSILLAEFHCVLMAEGKAQALAILWITSCSS